MFVRTRGAVGGRLPRPAKLRLVRLYSKWRYARRLSRADVVLISFAKSGRTWLRTMLGKAIAVHFGIPLENVLLLDKLARGRPAIPLVVETHDGANTRARPEDLVRSKTAYRHKKVVFLARDPRDVVVSAFFQASKRKRIFEGTLTEYLHQPVGSLDTILEFFNIWARQRHVPRGFHLVRYEDLHEDPHRQLRLVLNFVGLDEIGPEAIAAAVEFTSFENMRRLEVTGAIAGSMVLRPRDQSDEESYKTRRGKVGGFIDYLSEEDISYVNRRIALELDTFFDYGEKPGSARDACQRSPAR